MLGQYPIRVLPSKTAIVPVNNQYLPRTMEERELCSRTVYAANIDKKVDKWAVQDFFETLCGESWKWLIGCSSEGHFRRRQAGTEEPRQCRRGSQEAMPSAVQLHCICCRHLQDIMVRACRMSLRPGRGGGVGVGGGLLHQEHAAN